MYAIYGNIYHQYTPFMLVYIPAPWILWDIIYHLHMSHHFPMSFFSRLRGQWQIYRRTGTKTSCRLKTPRTAHMPGEGVTWGVWKKSKNGSWSD